MKGRAKKMECAPWPPPQPACLQAATPPAPLRAAAFCPLFPSPHGPALHTRFSGAGICRRPHTRFKSSTMKEVGREADHEGCRDAGEVPPARARVKAVEYWGIKAPREAASCPAGLVGKPCCSSTPAKWAARRRRPLLGGSRRLSALGPCRRARSGGLGALPSQRRGGAPPATRNRRRSERRSGRPVAKAAAPAPCPHAYHAAAPCALPGSPRPRSWRPPRPSWSMRQSARS
jgi:hypothetical protein